MTLTIPFSDTHSQYLEQVVSSGKYASPEEAVQALLERELLNRERERINTLIEEGFESGDAVEMTDADWTFIRKEVKARLSAATQ